ncbi:MAG: 1,4-beta-D-glucan glucohydrolase, partial [Gammaproteobacteria bacterium]
MPAVLRSIFRFTAARALSCSVLALTCASASHAAPVIDTSGLRPGADPAARERSITQLLGEMSPREKVAQMIQAEVAYIDPAQMREHCLGSILNGGGSYPGLDRRAPASAWVSMADAFWQALASV